MNDSQLKLNTSEVVSEKKERRPIPMSDIDQLLTTQILVAWAGERGEQPRLGWWRTDLVSEFGGKDLFQRLLPNTWRWAVLQGAREAARRHDALLRGQTHNPDLMISLYSLGFEIDERVEERLLDLIRLGGDPQAALPGLSQLLSETWDHRSFLDWVEGHGTCEYTSSPVGRWIKGDAPKSLDQLVRRLVAGLNPPPTDYPLPHFRRNA